ncbi:MULTISPECIES: hypothetical protein [Corynebacterium]|uniref:hypothetical protein n=1 Tax=Corynebacterium TaxID=1716 RepID=UPI0008A16F00|nr:MULTISPECIES: hypothetical protein [Corynebacterium]MDK8664599.1 hypothetical protein [Corynebacterium coyleae]MDK8707888.1 hypothetical protein [Corynebacterium coyleae]MDK8734591.1 hypothetical protein [Corynebacterium coyleae]MDK8893749.1 hypothetical protein [Corynebacterium coyleae]OFO33871.1 hypothetical protein HMPREF3048_09655 [Corynebacterium sp. HMSC075D04]
MTKFIPQNTRDLTESANSEGETPQEAVTHALIRVLPGFLNTEVFDTYALSEDLAQWLIADLEYLELDNYRHGSDYLKRKE